MRRVLVSDHEYLDKLLKKYPGVNETIVAEVAESLLIKRVKKELESKLDTFDNISLLEISHVYRGEQCLEAGDDLDKSPKKILQDTLNKQSQSSSSGSPKSKRKP